jgi:hypothetical protein
MESRAFKAEEDLDILTEYIQELQYELHTVTRAFNKHKIEHTK